MTAGWQALLLAASTLVSEDLACVAAGLLIFNGQLDPVLGVVACASGIFIGDLGLWLAGRLLRLRVTAAAPLPMLASVLEPDRIASAGDMLERRLGWAVLTSRAIPGTRLAMYLAAGFIGHRPLAFVGWTAFSVALWVPGLVLSIAAFGDRVVAPITAWLDTAWVALPLTAAAVFVPSRVATALRERRLHKT